MGEERFGRTLGLGGGEEEGESLGGCAVVLIVDFGGRKKAQAIATYTRMAA